MAKKRSRIHIGTSGWHYNHWKDRFYPAGLAKNKWFEYYAEHFETVELNNTFYQLPKEQSLQRWYELAPKDFVYSVKANRFITHIKRLKDSADELERFRQRIGILKEKRGPVLYQLPPSMRKDLGLLKDFMELLSKNEMSVFEFRHESWFSQDCYELLEQFNTGFCIHDLRGMKVPRVVTSDVIYIRFHGPAGRYAGNYSKSALQNWAEWINGNLKGKSAIFAYFNNDYNAYAIYNAKKLRELII
jgi:uncharacterized protein YecE (DUF72 family)